LRAVSQKRPLRTAGTVRDARGAAPLSPASAAPIPWKPTPAQLQAARTKTIRDLIRPGLRVLFVGINPGLYSGAVGHHFARPGNRFWPTLELSGFTPRRISPFEEEELLTLGLGVTNIVPRTTATADELSKHELTQGAAELEKKVRKFAPRAVAVLGVTAYRTAFGRTSAGVGPQTEVMGRTAVWVLPNPSGLNAHYQLPELAAWFAELRKAVDSP
jgi:TDG/mug DNA glycosylase family protein